MNLEIGNQFYFFNKSYPNLRVQRRQGAINKCPKGAIHKRQLSYYSIFSKNKSKKIIFVIKKLKRIQMYLEEQLWSFWLSSVELWIDIDSKSSEIVDKSSSSVKIENKMCYWKPR